MVNLFDYSFKIYTIAIKSRDILSINIIHSMKTKVEEIAFLQDWIKTILDFSFPTMDLPRVLKEQVYNDLEEAYKNQDIKCLRHNFRDLNEMVLDNSPEELNKLNRILKSKFGYDLNDNKNNNVVKIKSIITRGYIKTASEYRLLSNRVEQIYADEDKVDELEALNRLLFDFDSKHEPVND